MSIDIEKVILTDPYERSENEWLDILELLILHLSRSTGTNIEVGPYSIFKGSEYESVSLVAHIRSGQPFPGIFSDSWEAVACLTGNISGSWADVFVFPFLKGSIVTRNGRKADSIQKTSPDEFWLQYVDGRWERRGWYPADLSEWDYINEPGDICLCSLNCKPVSKYFAVGEPILINVEIEGIFLEPPKSDMELNNRNLRFSLIRVFRDRKLISQVSSDDSPPRSDSLQVRKVSNFLDKEQTSVQISLQWWNIPGEWLPGHYQVELRLQYSAARDSWNSDISEPIEFDISKNLHSL